MLIARGIIGAVLLFLGQELQFVFAGAMAGLIGFRLLPLLPPHWPWYYSYIFIGILALIAAAVPMLHERVGYFVSGFLAGGYILVEYFAPGVQAVPWLPFLVGGVLGSLFIGLLTHWALILVSSLFGAYYATGLFALPINVKILLTAGLFVIGALTQVIMWRMQKN